MEDRVYTEDHMGNTYEVNISDLEKGFKFVVPYSGPDEGKEIEISEEEVYKILDKHYEELQEQEEADWEYDEYIRQETHGWEQV